MDDDNPDGDWDRLEELIREIGNFSMDAVRGLPAPKRDEEARQEILALLAKSESRHGRLPRVLSARASYTEDSTESFKLLSEAFETAEKIEDDFECVWAAYSAACNTFDNGDYLAASVWLDRLADRLATSWDDWLHSQYLHMRDEIDGLNG